MPEPDRLYICWTTVSTIEQALELSELATEQKLAACAQIDSPIVSVYSWKGAVQRDEEFRIAFKALGARLDDLERAVLNAHPYETPQWICVASDKVAEKYLKWAGEVSNFPGFL